MTRLQEKESQSASQPSEWISDMHLLSDHLSCPQALVCSKIWCFLELMMMDPSTLYSDLPTWWFLSFCGFFLGSFLSYFLQLEAFVTVSFFSLPISGQKVLEKIITVVHSSLAAQFSFHNFQLQHNNVSLSGSRAPSSSWARALLK